MRLVVTTLVTALLLLGVILELLRRRQLREKYAFLWLAVVILILPIALFPRLLDSVALRLGIASGASLVLFLGLVFLLVICIHLSWEVSHLEEETRTLAEGLALLRAEVLGTPDPTAVFADPAKVFAEATKAFVASSGAPLVGTDPAAAAAVPDGSGAEATSRD